jgi:phosphoketolase
VLRLATTNPLTKEEWDKLRLYLDKSEKDELTPEEADELLELSKKVVREYSEYSEAWKLHIYATIIRTLTIMKYYKKGIR